MRKPEFSAWGPYSSCAYGANALHIPEPDRAGASEFILVLQQNYPDFKTHPALDIWESYSGGKERFQSSRRMRVLGWNIAPEKGYWSFLYLPCRDASCRLLAEFQASGELLRIRLVMENQTELAREWQLSLYASPVACEKLEGTKFKSRTPYDIEFNLLKDVWRVKTKNISFSHSRFISVAKFDWLRFPANIEAPTNRDNPLSDTKQRVCITTAPIYIGPYQTIVEPVELFRGGGRLKRKSFHAPAAPCAAELPYLHQWWETLHNRQYVRSFSSRRMVLRVMPAPQWGNFFLWDAGMTLIGAAEKDTGFVEEQLYEMPDPKKLGETIFKNMGAFIPTCIFAWWEAFCRTLDSGILQRHYYHMLRLFYAFYSRPLLMPGGSHDGLVRGLSNGMDDYPARVYCSGNPFSWDYSDTLPVNPERMPEEAAQPGLTALAIRFARILRLAAWSMGKADDVFMLDNLIKRSGAAMDSRLWDKKAGMYLWSTKKDGKLPMTGIDGCYPLLSGMTGRGKKAKLLSHLLDPDGMWTENGLTAVPRNNRSYREKGYWNGAVWMPPQWLAWKIFYNLGMDHEANLLSERVMNLWEKAHGNTLCCWENFRVAGGEGAGNSRFSGLSAPILSLYAARRQAGRAQFGQDVFPHSLEISATGNCEAVVSAPFGEVKTCISAVLKPDCRYSLLADGKIVDETASDKYGHVIFSAKAGVEPVSLKMESIRRGSGNPRK